MQRWAVLRKINDTVLVFQTLSWLPAIISLGSQSSFSPLVLFGTLDSCLIESTVFRSKIKHSLRFNPNSPWCSQPSFFFSHACLPGGPTTRQVAKLLNSGSAFNVLVLPSQERELWTRSIMDLSGHEIRGLRRHFPVADSMRSGNLQGISLCD